MDHDDVAPAAPLELRVAVHLDLVHANSDGITQHGVDRTVPVRMHSNTPFKSLKDKLHEIYDGTPVERYGKMDLRQAHSPLQCIFDSDTPASVSISRSFLNSL